MKSDLSILSFLTVRADASGGHAVLTLPEWTKVMAVLLLSAATIRLFHLEEDLHLPQLMPYLVGGVAVYTLLPLSWRLPSLLLLNLVAMVGLLGWSDGFLLAGLSLGLFGLAHLPLSISYRMLAVTAAGLLLALLRAGWLSWVDHPRVLSILGSLFMFRMILYMYEMRFDKSPASFGWHRLAYFFMLPNLVLLIFPTVDYQTFIRGYYAKPAYEIHRTALLRIANGIFHLLMYRLVYYYLLPNPAEVDGLLQGAQYLVVSYLLIIRLAGLFHLSVGILGLFGFDLPPVFRHYFFADSFSDLWRRINIYWREFVVKLFYMPLYFKFKRHGQVFGMTVAILLVFVVNAFLHSYQWFWIRGDFTLTAQDAIFWSVFGMAVAVNGIQETKRKRSPGFPGRFSLRAAGLRMLRIMGVFLSMVFLWSFWTSESIATWWTLLKSMAHGSMAEVLLLLGLASGVFLSGVLFQYLYARRKSASVLRQTETDVSLRWVASGLLLLTLFGLPGCYEKLERKLSVSLDPVLYTRLNTYDADREFEGYYEELLERNDLDSRLSARTKEKPRKDRLVDRLSTTKLQDIRQKSLTPLHRIFAKGAWVTTNEFGMRDRAYALAKAPNTLRIVLLGGSVEMGTGVSDEDTFENLVEDELNRRRLFGKDVRVEILNLALPGAHLPDNLARMVLDIDRFGPDAVIYSMHLRERKKSIQRLFKAVDKKTNLVLPFLDSMVHRIGIHPGMTNREKLLLTTDKTMDGWLRQAFVFFADHCRQKGYVPVSIYVPVPDPSCRENLAKAKKVMSLAREAGAHVLDLSAAYEGHDIWQLRLARRDLHPNKEGHRLIAKAFLEQFLGDEGLLSALRSQVGTDAD
jgi:hypothetical protein